MICGPSGTGKSTLLKKLFDDFPGKFGFSISRESCFPTSPGYLHLAHVERRLTPCSFFASLPCSPIDTTRAPRPGEENGVSYHFTTRDSFLDLVKADGFIEHAEFSGNMYGTSVKAVQDVAKDGGKKCILDIDTQVSRRGFNRSSAKKGS